MNARLAHLRTSPSAFRHLTGLTVGAFAPRARDVVPLIGSAHRATLDRPNRERAAGAGGEFAPGTADPLLATVVWVRQYPTQEVLGSLFGVSDSTAGRVVDRCLPVLGKAGRDTARMPDPGPGRRKRLPALLADTPGLAVVIASFEPRTHRPRRRQRAYYSGNKRAHTLTSQVGVDEGTGAIVDGVDSGPWADIARPKTSRLLKRLPPGVGGIGDPGYAGIGERHPKGLGGAPRTTPRGKDRRPEDRAYNRAFRRRRIVVEHTIGRLRRFRALSHVNRHRRKGHAARVRAVAGLVNRMIAAPAPKSTTTSQP